MKMLMFDFRESEKEFFKEHSFDNYEIEFIKSPLNSLYELNEEQIEETVILSVFITSELTEYTLKKFKNLQVIATRSTGYSHIDIDYCKKHNIAVINVPNYGATSVAQYTFMLILMTIRKVISAFEDIKANKICLSEYEGKETDGMTLGIIGSGTIGGAVAEIANFFGMKIYVCSKIKNPKISSFVEYVSLEKLLKSSDIITLHLPFSEETYHLIDEKSFSLMKDGVFIVNTARGEIIDIQALYNNVISGKVAGVALDVLECEAVSVGNIIPNDNKCALKALIVQKLLAERNVIITPHIAYNTNLSINYILNSLFISISDYYKGRHTNQIL
ncbi:MAG: lactate dehydrogenase [bacterium]|nr:lactate dehydrogenase [bacterium]